MTATGHVRRFDDLGRIVIPREVRKNVFGRIDVQDIPMEIFYNKENGDDIYYRESENRLVIVSTDGYIRTYFRPEDGIRYYEKK